MDQRVLFLLICGVTVVETLTNLLKPKQNQRVTQKPLLYLAFLNVLAEIPVLAVLKEDIKRVFVIPGLEILNDLDNIIVLDLLKL